MLDAGQVLVYDWNGSTWDLAQQIDGAAGFDNLGFSVALNGSGDRVGVGAIQTDQPVNNAGHAAVYQLASDGTLVTPDNVTIQNSTCSAGGCGAEGGSITAPANGCPDGTTLEYSVDGEITQQNYLYIIRMDQHKV